MSGNPVSITILNLNQISQLSNFKVSQRVAQARSPSDRKGSGAADREAYADRWEDLPANPQVCDHGRLGSGMIRTPKKHEETGYLT